MNTQAITTISCAAALLASSAITTPAVADNGIAANGHIALQQVRAELLAPPTATERVRILQQSLEDVRVVPGLNAIRTQGQLALAKLRFERLRALLQKPPVILHPGVPVTRSVSQTDSPSEGAGEDAHGGDWSLPRFDPKPLIDPTVLFFSFGR